MKNKIYITNEHEDVSIELTLSSESASDPEQLIVRSVKALLRTLDIKDYARHHGGRARQRFASDLDEIARTIHDVAYMGGFTDGKE